MNLAIIPARAGSKGIPGKNLVDFCGKPLIQYTIEAALSCSLADDVILSTDSLEIKDAALKAGLNTEYLRPEHLATDRSSMVDVVLDCLDWYLNNVNGGVENILLLQPTSPLRTAYDIDAALNLYLESRAHSLISVNKVAHHPYECLKGKSTDWVYLAKPNVNATRRQDYDDNFYFINGAIYISSVAHLRKSKNFIDEKKSVLYVMSQEKGLDIDYMEDLVYGEFILKNSMK